MVRRVFFKAVIAAATVVLSLAGTLANANASGSTNRYSPDDHVPTNVWRVVSVGSFYHTYGHDWYDCNTLKSESYSYTATCGSTYGGSNSVTGSVGVSADDVSEMVGFNVTSTYTITESDSFTVPAHRSGELQWRRVYNTRSFTEHEYSCETSSSCFYENKSQTGHASKFDDIEFQMVLN